MPASTIKTEESPDSFLRAILRTSTLPPAEHPDAVSASSAASIYQEEDVKPPMSLSTTMHAHQRLKSRGSSISSNHASQGSSPSPRTYKSERHFSRDLFFPSHDLMNTAPQQALEHTMLQNDVNSNMPIDFGGYEQAAEQLPRQQLQLDGTYRVRSNSEGIHDLVVASRNMMQGISTLVTRVNNLECNLVARINTIEANAITVCNTAVELSKNSLSAPGPTYRFHDAINSSLPNPSTPIKQGYVPFQTFQLSSPGPEVEEAFGSKLTGGKNDGKKKRTERTLARKSLSVKIPESTIPSTAPLTQKDSGYLTGTMTSSFPSFTTPTSGPPTGPLTPGNPTTPTSAVFLQSPLTPGRIGPLTPSKRGGTSANKRKNHKLKESMPPALAMVPNIPLTDTELIVYFYQSVARPAVALRLYSRGWGPAGIVDVLNTHRDIEGGYLRNTCSVKCTTAINRGRTKYGPTWEADLARLFASADDLVATDLIRYSAAELPSAVDYEVRALGMALKKYPEVGVDGGIFTRCVRYCVEQDGEGEWTLANVHELAMALQKGGEEEVFAETEGVGGQIGEAV